MALEFSKLHRDIVVRTEVQFYVLKKNTAILLREGPFPVLKKGGVARVNKKTRFCFHSTVKSTIYI